MHALITGGAGFIGAHLAQYLLDTGHRVALADDFSRGVHDETIQRLASHERATLHSIDLTRAESWRALPNDVDVVFHLAAIVGVANVLRAAYDVLERNVRMTTEAIAWMRTQAGSARLVFMSTSEVYAGSLQHLAMPIPTPEDTPIALPALHDARTTYLLSKLYGEALCQQSGVPFTIVRPHNVYGARMGEAHVIPQLLRRAYDTPDGGRLAVYSPGHQRTFCHVSDAVRWLATLAESPAAQGETFNLGTDAREVTIADLAQMVCDTVGRSLTLDPHDDTPGSPARRCPDLTRLRAVTDAVPRMTLEAGLRDTFAWYRPFFVRGVKSSTDPDTDR
jgi:nucleoside-diphosphate-sugar epimerase